MTVHSPVPAPDPSDHRTTRCVGYGRFSRVSNYVALENFVKIMTVVTAGVTATTYAYEVWNWFQSIYWLW
jgi:hypothetical protein